MKRYFSNPELKISSGILLCLMILFLLCTSLILKVHNNNLKKDYIESLGAITIRIVEKSPQLEKEIIPIVTKGYSREEAAKGRALLSSYGLTETLESELFPHINSTYMKNNYSIIVIFVLMFIIFFIFNYFQYGFFYERIRRLTIGAKKVVEGEYHITISENKEGDLSKLAVSFNSMKETIRKNLSELRREKQFLVDLLSDISHQLKTPLASMVVYNDIMLNKELTTEQRQTFLMNNQNQLQRMQWLIQSILKLAKLDAKAIELSKEEDSLNETLKDAIEALESKALEGQITIGFVEKENVIFNHDKLWLQEAFINIIKNCIEHTSKGGELNLELIENPIYRRIVIEDTGEGIREEDLPNIFKRFYKGRTSRKKDSIGIGLALSKSIVEAHNGIIEVQSKVGVGTKFTITFLKY